MITRKRFLLMLPLALFACEVSTGQEPGSLGGPASGPTTHVTPTLVPGNPTCTSLGYAYGYKFDFGTQGTFDVDLGGGNTITYTYDGTDIDWSATLGIDAVIVKGSNSGNVYAYDPEAMSDTGLVTPLNESGGNAGLSHIEFCYDWEVQVAKTATPSLTRTYSWDIDKTSSVTELLLSIGQTYMASYTVTLSVTGTEDSNWAIAGTITVTNPDPSNSATVTGVTDVFEGIVIPVTCAGVTFPKTLAPGASFGCTYSTGLPSAINGTNTATAATTGLVGPGSGTASVDFANATVTAVDDCVDVTDDKYGDLGTVCAGDADKTFDYTLQIGPYATCGSYTYTNTASFVTDDSGATGSDDHDIAVEVACEEEGCSLTPGYWKTHSIYGPAPYDDTWAMLSDGENTAFFLSGKTWYEVLWTPPQGNAYYILAHAYIAAVLNDLNGADTSSITATLAAAKALLEAWTPAQIAGLRGQAKFTWTSLAATLDDYNNGEIGPGHCDEEPIFLAQ